VHAVTPTSTFDFRYASRGARNAYIAAMMGGAFGTLFAVALQTWGLLVPSLALAAIAERLRPYLGEYAQIRLDTNGMTLRGLGFLPWRAVTEARAFEHATPGGTRVWLMLELDHEMEEDIPFGRRILSLVKRLQARPWRLVGERGLILRLENLDHTPDVIRRAIEAFSNRRIAVDRV
jgi:hypothetical protein